MCCVRVCESCVWVESKQQASTCMQRRESGRWARPLMAFWDASTNTPSSTDVFTAHRRICVHIWCVYICSELTHSLFQTGNFPLLPLAFACVLISSSSILYLVMIFSPSIHLSLSLIDLLPKGCSGLRDHSTQCYGDMALHTHYACMHNAYTYIFTAPCTCEHPYHA